MPQIQKPDFTYKWASGGLSVSPSTTKIQTGWTAEVPPFQWENWSQNRQDQGISHIMQHGISVWDALTEYQYGANSVKSLVMGSNGIVYRAKQINTNQDPVADTANLYWETAYASFSDLAAATQIASAAQAQAQTANNVFITPQRLADAFKGANQSLTANGYQRIPGGLILQWGTASTGATSATVSFPIQFPTTCIFASATDSENVPANVRYSGMSNRTSSNVLFTFNGSPADFFWYALGY